MKVSNTSLISIPVEFSVACMIYKITVKQALQLFIDHITLYDSFSETYSKGFTEASGTITTFLQTKEKKPGLGKAFQNCRDLAAPCLALIIRLSKSTIKTSVKRKRAIPYVNDLFKLAERIYTPSKTLHLDENSAIELSKDFCILCELYNTEPKEFLENFMGRISLADAHARQGLNQQIPDFALDFFMLIASGFARETPDLQRLTETETEFYQQMKEIQLSLYNIRNLSERTEILKDYYYSHYSKMITNY